MTSFNAHLPYNKRQEISIKLPQLALERMEKAQIGSGQITQSISRLSQSRGSSKSFEREVAVTTARHWQSSPYSKLSNKQSHVSPTLKSPAVVDVNNEGLLATREFKSSALKP